jgi:hypothetical protein
MQINKQESFYIAE